MFFEKVPDCNYLAWFDKASVAHAVAKLLDIGLCLALV